MTDLTNLGSIPAPVEGDGKPLFVTWEFDGREVSVTPAQFDAMCDRAASDFLGRGLVRGDRVGILSLNRLEYLIAVMGAMRAGIVPVPINPKFPAATVAYIVEDAELKLVLHEEDRAGLLAGLSVERLGIGGAFADPPGSDAMTAITPGPDETALILYTSGSTGRPKGVRLSHAAHRWVAEARVEGYRLHEERVLIAAPLYHMNALALSFLVCASRSTAIILPQFKARHYIRAIERYGCTWLTAVPPMIAMMLQETETLQSTDLSSVRTIRMGSAPVNETLEAETRVLLPNARIINAYGTTEGGPIVFAEHPDGRSKPTGSVGRAHNAVQLRLAGPDAPREGVLQLRSPGMMLGYLDPEKTRAAITSDGFYDTGDIFRVDDEGFYYFLGRSDDMFVSGGENIFPIEVENLIEAHEDVMQSCVVPVEDAVKGTKPVAFVVRRSSATLDEEAVKAHVLSHAPAYLHPRRVWFVDRLMLSTTNKLDRNAMRHKAEVTLAQESSAPANEPIR